MRFLHSASLVATLATLATADSSSTAVLTQTGFGDGTQVTVCTAQFTLPILEANGTEGSGGGSETTSSPKATSTDSAAAPHLLDYRTTTASMLVALILAGTLY